jgi:mono/diheme cytochrome c family protein
MTRKMVIAGLYVAAAGLLLAMGAAAHYSNNGENQPVALPGAVATGRAMTVGQMGQGMMQQNQNMMDARERMRRLVDELRENQGAMEKARNFRKIKPLLKQNGELLGRLSGEMGRAWGMQGSMKGSMGSRMAPTKTAQSQAAAAASRSKASSAAHTRLVAEGKQVFQAAGCIVCHGNDGIGTAAAPSLINIGKKFSGQQLAELIRHPATPRMPAFSMSAMPDTKLEAVIAYLQTLR